MNETKKKNATLQNKAKHSIEKNSDPGLSHLANENIGGIKRMKNRETKERGITLIALVITIIVLLILAGVAVSMALNEGNLFAKANEAKTSWNMKTEEEENEVNNALAYIEQYVEGEGGGGAGTPTPGGLPAGWSSTAVASVVTETSEVEGVSKERKVPIPTGFKVSIYNDTIGNETTIAGGLVIYETNTDLQPDQGSSTANHETAMTTYNQYVWIPVDNINSMIMCDSHTASSDCNIVIDDTTGKIYCSNHMTVSDAEKTNTTSKFLCGKLYATNATTTDTSKPYIYTTSMTFSTNNQTYSANSDFREPAVLTGSNAGTGTDYDASGTYSIKNETGTSIAGGTNGSDILVELKRQFNNMAKSVATYGGFYIARYEVGYDATTCTSKKGQVVMDATTTANKGANMWYGLYNHIIGTKGGTTSQMIWGSEYDQVINFIGSEAQTGHTDRNLYSNSSSGTTSGTTPLDKMKNIYDLEGNYYEWTSKAYNTNSRVGRGGGYSRVSGSRFNSASYRNNLSPNSMDGVISSRQSLYVSL